MVSPRELSLGYVSWYIMHHALTDYQISWGLECYSNRGVFCAKAFEPTKVDRQLEFEMMIKNMAPLNVAEFSLEVSRHVRKHVQPAVGQSVYVLSDDEDAENE